MNSHSSREGLVDIQLKQNGQDIDDLLLNSLLSVRVQQQLSASALTEVIFHNQLTLSLDEFVFEMGDDLQIRIGGDGLVLFAGKVTEIDYRYGAAGEALLYIRAHDALHYLGRQQQIRSHVKTNIYQLAKEWSRQIGLTVKTHANVSPSDWDWKIQYQQTDWEWLADLAHQQGYYFHVHGSDLHLFTLEGMGVPIDLQRDENIREATFTQNSQYACDGVQTTGWNTTNLKNTQGNVGHKSSLGKATTRHLIDYPVHTKQQAEKLAQGVFDRCKAGENSFWGIVEGHSGFYPGRRLKIHGFATSLVDEYTLTQVTHTINAEQGFISELSTIPSSLASPATQTKQYPSHHAMLGAVSNIADPEQAGRIKVSLPTYDNTETDWLPVIQVAAGKHKGLLALPDCGDIVALLPLTNDPTQAVVLGGLYGMDELADKKSVRGDKVTRYAFMTPTGHYLRFDEKDKTTTLHNSNGSFIKLSPTKTHIHAETNLILEASGKNITIKAAKIDFEKG